MAESGIDKLFKAIDLPLSPLPKETYLEIWDEQEDLQLLYPEAKIGNFYNFREWASSEGWKTDERLAIFIPEGQIPGYGIPPEKIVGDTTEQVPTEKIVVDTIIQPDEGTNFTLIYLGIILGIGAGLGVFFYWKLAIKKNKLPIGSI